MIILEWKEIWKKVILCAFDKTYQSLAELEEELRYKHIKIVFLIDGLEEIFEHTISSENEKMQLGHYVGIWLTK